VKSVSARLGELPPEKRALVEARLQQARDARPSEIARRDENVPAPLSFAQELAYRIERAAGGTSPYRVPRALCISGPLDVERLHAALDALVERHHVLRTTFGERDGEPVQNVGPARSLDVRVVSLESTPREERDHELTRVLRAAIDEPFDLARDPMLRATLVRVRDDEHVLLLVAHHIAWDLGSHDIALAEIAQHYTASAHNGSVARAPLPLQYADFSAWERRSLQGERLTELLGYWRAELAGVPEVLALPTDAPRQAIPGDAGLRRKATLPARVVEPLLALAAQSGTTPFVTFAAAFATLLYRYAGDEDVVLGCAVAGRTRSELEPLIGYFSNMLPLRARFADDPTFADVLATVRGGFLRALEHAEIPYEKLAFELLPARASAAVSPLFGAAFDLRHAGGELSAFGAATVKPMPIERCVAKFDLSLTVVLTPASAQRPASAVLDLKGRSPLFEGATLERMLHHLAVLLRGIVAEPQGRVSRLPLLDENERREQLESSERTRAQTFHDTIDGLITAQAARTPTAVALEYDDELPESLGGASASDSTSLSYAQLDARASSLAHRLRVLGVGPGVGVALVAERSPELVIGMLGVLRAGGYYVPIDPAYPAERIAFVLRDCGVTVALTLQRLRPLLSRVAAGVHTTVLSLDALPLDEPQSASEPPIAPHTPDDLAYIIYTSGSTGEPKGVMVAHKAVANYLSWMRDAYDVTPRDAVLQRAPASFDASVWELFLPLVAGARLVLARRGAHGDPAYLADVVERRHISLLQLVPSQLPAVLDTPGASAALARLRRLFLGGEALPSTLLTRLLGDCPTLAITNLYGPTEATVYATYWDVDRARWNGGAVSLGTPIRNVTVNVRDAHMQPVPLGVKGELCIGGAGIARGYFGRPALTDERFVPDRSMAPADARLYRTGDLVRYRGDGTLEFLGRLDAQVKVRGFRVELGEIESALVALPEVRAATVLLREDVPGDPRLVAYCIPARGEADEAHAFTESIRKRLAEVLPSAIVPTAYVWLASWPLNPNGKLDRRSLPAPDAHGPRERTIIAPRNACEGAILNLFADVLGTTAERISIDDDFFALGGHSLLAMRLVGRVSAAFGVTVSLRAFFENGTPQRLAESIAGTSGADDAQASPIRRRASQDEAPLTAAQETLWLLSGSQPNSSAYSVRVARRLRGRLDEDALRSAVDLVVERHAALRTIFSARDGNPVQRIGAPRPAPFETVDLETLAADAREAAALQRLQAFASWPFDLGRDVLLRALLVRLASDDHIFLMVSHHIVADGASVNVLLRDVAELYAAQEADRASALPPLPIEFTDYAVWQRDRLAGPRLGALKAFWDAELAERPAAPALPLDRPRGLLPSFVGAHQTALLPHALLDDLRGLARSADVTLYTVLLAAYATLLHRYTGQTDIIVGSPVAGRQRPELESVVGYFVNTLPLRARFESDPRFADVLAAIRKTTLGALEHQDAPFDVLQNAGAGTSGAAPYQTMFILQNALSAEAKLGSLTATPVGFESGVAKLDLTVSVTELNGALRVSFEYRTDLFEAATIERLLSHFRTLLEGIAADPARRVSALPLVTEDERRRLVSTWNATAADYRRDATLPELVSAQVAARPHACAVIAEDRSLSYSELGTQAAAFSRRLRAAGVRPGTFVGVCLERSSEMLVALLGVLEAGGAYVPLDPAFPPARLAFMLDDCRAAVIVTQGSLRTFVDGIVREASDAAADYAPGVSCIDEPDETPVAAADPQTQPERGAATDIAYLLYTSGTTGRPKGVAVTHRSGINFLSSMAREPGLGADDTLLAVTTLSFDIAGLELWLPLVVGARVALAPREASMDGHRLAELLSSSRATMLQATPTTWRLLLAARWQGDQNLVMLCGGEALPPDLASELLPRGRALWNMYGPTETTIWSALQRVSLGDPISLGAPIANTQLYVLEPGGDVAPLGVAGELCIGGDGVSNGYLHLPELTAERFIADPFRAESGAHLYRTGDRVRRYANGRLEYLGRLDDQVKLRGFRIELAEIEAALRAHPRVATAAAALHSDGSGEPSLVGYYVLQPSTHAGDGSEAIEPAMLREHLRTLLPGYMLPTFLVQLDALPLTPSGKIDRAALPAPESNDRVHTRAAFVAPRTPTETTVAQIWARALGIDEVSVTESFFALGGHSISALRILAQVDARCGVHVPFNFIFERPTVADMAAGVDGWSRSGVSPSRPVLRRAARTVVGVQR